MASKLPIICSDLPGLNEVITDGFSALTINPNDMDDLFAKISKLHDDEELRCRLMVNAHETVQKFDEKKLVKDIESVYLEVTSN